MPYIPKSKITILSTNGGELLVKSTRKPYNGFYIKVSNGKYYAGTSNINLGSELILADVDNIGAGERTTKELGYGYDVKKFKLLKKQIKNRLEKTKPLPAAKTVPNELNYLNGFYTRYFTKRVNGNNYLEIDKDTYDSINKKESKYDYNLYQVGSIRWYITGNDVHRQNSLEIKRTERAFPNIFYLFPVLNEFLRPSTKVQENLSTNGGELYYGDGVEYVGLYHIHPLQGPMVGATHTMVPHAKLYYFNQLPQVGDSSYEDFLAEYNKITCYKCLKNVSLQGISYNIESIQRSRLLGCPANSFPTYDLAQQACQPIEMLEASPTTNITGRPNTYTSNGDWGPATFPGGGDYSGFPPGGNSGGTNYGNTSTGGGGGGGGGGSTGGIGTYTCFTANTLVTMADGTEKTISSIKVGEKVKSETGESTVLDIQIHEGDHEVYSINNSKPFVTEEHPFKTIDGWKAIDPFLTFEKHQISSDVLNLQDIVYKIDGEEVIESIKKGPIKYPKVYNLSLDNEHVYYANGYLVHNEKGSGASGLDDLNDMQSGLGDASNNLGGNTPPPPTFPL